METQTPISELVTHADFLHRLAAHLVRNPHDADDAVQDAFVAAIERPPTIYGTPRAWLSTVLRNRIRMTKRSESRRTARERAAVRSPADASSLDAAASIETAGRLVSAVESLDEPYRTVVVLRYYHDLRFAEIAERLGRPVATVRTHHHRALARLREELDRRWSGRRRAWVLALLPLARGRAAPRGVLTGLVVAALLLLCGIPLILGGGDPGPAVRPESGHPEPEPAVAVKDPEPRAESDRPDVAPATEGEDGATVPDGVAVVRLTDESGDPVVGVRVRLLDSPVSLDSYVLPHVVAEAFSDEFGRVRFDVDPFTRYAAKAEHPDFAVGGDIYCFGGSVTDFRMSRPAVVTGVVRDRENRLPVPGATVYAMDWGGPGVIHEWKATTDREGRYRITGLGKGFYNLSAWKSGTQSAYPVRPRPIDPATENVIDFELVRTPPIVLRIVDGITGQPLPAVTVKWMQRGTVTGPGDALATFPVSPRFRTSMIVAAPGWFDRSVLVPVEALRTPETPFLVRMTRCIPVTGRVETGPGEPVAGVEVFLVVRGDQDREVTICEVRTAEDGTFRVDCGLPGGTIRLEVHAGHRTVLLDKLHAVPADATELRLGAIVVPDTAAVSGCVHGPGGERITSGIVRVGRRSPEGYSPWTESWIDPRGRFRLPGVPVGEREIVLADVDGIPVQSRKEKVRAGLRLDWRIPPGQVITGRVVDEQGRPVPLKYIVLKPGDALTRADDEGRFRFRALPAGNFRLTFKMHPNAPGLTVPGNSYDVEVPLILP